MKVALVRQSVLGLLRVFFCVLSWRRLVDQQFQEKRIFGHCPHTHGRPTTKNTLLNGIVFALRWLFQEWIVHIWCMLFDVKTSEKDPSSSLCVNCSFICRHAGPFCRVWTSNAQANLLGLCLPWIVFHIFALGGNIERTMLCCTQDVRAPSTSNMFIKSEGQWKCTTNMRVYL